MGFDTSARAAFLLFIASSFDDLCYVQVMGSTSFQKKAPRSAGRWREYLPPPFPLMTDC
jgi:hypothetical protein